MITRGRKRRRLRSELCAWLWWPSIRTRSAWVRHELHFSCRLYECTVGFSIECDGLFDRRPSELVIHSPEAHTFAVARMRHNTRASQSFLLCNCGRRIRKLWRTPAGRWGCARCLRLSWDSESRRSDGIDQLNRRIERLETRIKRTGHAGWRRRLRSQLIGLEMLRDGMVDAVMSGWAAKAREFGNEGADAWLRSYR